MRLNNIEAIKNTGVFGKYASLKSIDLSNNQIKIIEDGAFEGAKNLEELFVCVYYFDLLLFFLLKK